MTIVGRRCHWAKAEICVAHGADIHRLGGINYREASGALSIQSQYSVIFTVIVWRREKYKIFPTGVSGIAIPMMPYCFLRLVYVITLGKFYFVANGKSTLKYFGHLKGGGGIMRKADSRAVDEPRIIVVYPFNDMIGMFSNLTNVVIKGCGHGAATVYHSSVAGIVSFDDF